MSEARDVIIIGSGPAGYTAAIYAARANLKPLLFEGMQPGGQLTITTDVENYPGYPDGVLGPEDDGGLPGPGGSASARTSASSEIVEVDFSQAAVHAQDGFRGVPDQGRDRGDRRQREAARSGGEKRLMGHGVSACATCDGAFFPRQGRPRRRRRRHGDGGGQFPHALRDEGHDRAPPRRLPRLEDHARSRAEESQDRVAAEQGRRRHPVRARTARCEQVAAGGHGLRREEHEVQSDGIFIAIGHKPNSQIFQGKLDMDETGYLRVQRGTYTSVEGVFACGRRHGQGLPPGGDGRGHGLHGGDRRRALARVAGTLSTRRVT